jgi:molecular chaperone GrpE (heat shock protein)
VRRYKEAFEQKQKNLDMINERLQREREEWNDQETGEAIQKTVENLLKGNVYDQFVRFLRGALNVPEIEDPIASLQKAVVEIKNDLYHPLSK